MNNFPVVDYGYVKEHYGIKVDGDYYYDDYILYCVNDEIVKVNVDVPFLRKLLFEERQLVNALLNTVEEKEGR